MHKLFNNILIPIDTSASTERMLEKGIELANTYSCNIHLLYSTATDPKGQALKKIQQFFSFSGIPAEKKAEQKLNFMLSKFRKQLQDGLKIHIHSENGNRNDIAINYIIQNKIDLVLGTVHSRSINRNKLSLDVNRIAGKTSAAVITVPEDRHIRHLYSIVIPVTDFIPLRKLMYGIYLARYYKTTIHLLGITREQDIEYTQRVQKYLHRSYQLIRDNCDVPIDLTVRDGSNVAEVVKEYASSNNTDLVIVNPGGQSRLKSHTLGWFAGILQKNIHPPVLTIGTP
ncbi:MAG TPA: universal stress protein [Chitinophagaceae bacterium]|jgi:nucleotide-binding universal stress UspA family protein|nr:universal stress protein [Chitinophagaceae bacterium]